MSGRIYETLDDAIHAVVYETPGVTAKALAGTLGVRYGYLADSANPDREDTQFQARLIVPITLASGNDAIVKFICRRVGGVFVRLPNGAGSDELTARSLKEVGDYLHAVAESGRDGKVTEAEANEIDRQVTEAVEALLSHARSVRARVVARSA